MLRGALYHILKYINVHSVPEGRSRVTHGRADPWGGGIQNTCSTTSQTPPMPEKTFRHFPNDLESSVYF